MISCVFTIRYRRDFSSMELPYRIKRPHPVKGYGPDPSCRIRSSMYNRIRLSFKDFLRSGVHFRLHAGIAACQIHLDMFYFSSFFSHTSALSISLFSEILFATMSM